MELSVASWLPLTVTDALAFLCKRHFLTRTVIRSRTSSARTVTHTPAPTVMPTMTGMERGLSAEMVGTGAEGMEKVLLTVKFGGWFNFSNLEIYN